MRANRLNLPWDKVPAGLGMFPLCLRPSGSTKPIADDRRPGRKQSFFKMLNYETCFILSLAVISNSVQSWSTQGRTVEVSCK